MNVTAEAKGCPEGYVGKAVKKKNPRRSGASSIGGIFSLEIMCGENKIQMTLGAYRKRVTDCQLYCSCFVLL